MVAHDEHVWAVGVVAVVADEGVVFTAFNVLGDFQPWRGVAIVPSFVGVGVGFLAPCIDPTIQSLMEFKNVRILFSKSLHSLLHGLVGVVFLELQNPFAFVGPRENHVDVILRPNVLRGVAHGRFLDKGAAGNGAGQRQQKGEGDEEAQCRARSGGARC